MNSAQPSGLRLLVPVGTAVVVWVTPGSAKPDSVHPPFTIVRTEAGPEVRLAPALARVVARAYPDFRLPTPAEEDPQLRVIWVEHHPKSQVTYAASGDFSGDGRTDAVLRLRSRRSRDRVIVVAFHAARSGAYEPHALDLGARMSTGFCIARARPGPLTYVRYRGEEILSRPGILQLRHDGIELSEPESWSRVYYWDGSRYRHVQTRD